MTIFKNRRLNIQKKRRKKKFFFWFLGGILIFSLFFFLQYKKTIQGFDSSERIPVLIEYKTPVTEIVAILKHKGIILAEWPMLFYLKINNLSSNLQAGDFIIKKGISIPELVEILSNAHVQEIPLRIIEGQTIDDIDHLLVEKKLIKAGDFINCAKQCRFPSHNFVYDGNLEGFLFPDTYYVDIKNFDLKKFMERMLNNFSKRFLSEDNKQIYKSQNKKLADIVIMASILEKEEHNKENLTMISGILWKRLAKGIPLGADATTRYYEKNKSGFLSKKDFEKNNPYNTRKYLGLPPTAISNPGLAALKASLFPEKSKYYYYLHDSTGQIHYAVTNDEHNANKARYLR